MNPLDPNTYRARNGARYESSQVRLRGFTVVSVLREVWGRELNEISMGFIHSLRPSAVRFAFDGVLLDATPWRVTIFLVKKDGREFIQNIVQEVEVGLPDGVENSIDLRSKLA
jgi:hypothetical protein